MHQLFHKKVHTHLDEVPEEVVSDCIFPFHVGELIGESETESLELKVRVLTTGYFVDVDVSISTLHGCGAFEGCVQTSRLLPKLVVLRYVLKGDAWRKGK